MACSARPERQKGSKFTFAKFDSPKSKITALHRRFLPLICMINRSNFTIAGKILRPPSLSQEQEP